MTRRKIETIGAVTALVVAGVLVFGAAVLFDNANFAAANVRDQLAIEKISFKPADKFTEAERDFTNARTGCALAHAGQPITTGRQAECFANEYMLGHLLDPARGNEGLTFAEWGDIQAGLRARIAVAKENNDPGLATLEDELAASEVARNTAFRGAMLRNALLTAYGFGVLGEKAAEAAAWLIGAAALLFIGGLAGFGHLFLTRERRVVVRAAARHIPA
jgi:hypothetical protein